MGLSGTAFSDVTPGYTRPTVEQSNDSQKWVPASKAFEMSEINQSIKADIKAFRRWNFLHVQATRLTTISCVVYNQSYDLWVNLHLTLETPMGSGSGAASEKPECGTEIV
jgi:hypothetical protein